MTDRPILMSGPMVRATLREIKHPGTGKTQTRRGLYTLTKNWRSAKVDARYEPPSALLAPVDRFWTLSGWQDTKPGDRLWVRESWNVFALSQDCEVSWPLKAIPAEDPRDAAERNHIVLDYPVVGLDGYDGGKGPFRPSIHMPRWASRITLLVDAVKVERLQDISEDDARAEGISAQDVLRLDRDCPDCRGRGAICASDRPDLEDMQGEQCRACSRLAFEILWESINGPGSWDANPWVCAVSFRPILANIDSVES